MAINARNPFKGRQYPGEVIVLCVRWYLRYPLSYEHVSEMMAERGVEVDASCIWRWVQAYAPELNKRCRPHLKPTNKSYRIDETYIKVRINDAGFGSVIHLGSGEYPGLRILNQSWPYSPSFRLATIPSRLYWQTVRNRAAP